MVMRATSEPGPALQPKPNAFLPIVLAVAGILVLQAVVLLAMGQPPICTCGAVRLWIGSVRSSETSQQITDWYSFSHVVHGFGFYLLLWLVAPRSSFGFRLALAVGLEAGWEIIENTPLVVERYRQQALAQGYVGDSLLNSISDSLSAIAGFVLARVLPVLSSIALVVAIELFLVVMIRDNLTLNIIQLIHPISAISLWQSGA